MAISAERKSAYSGLVYIGAYGPAEQATIHACRFDGHTGELKLQESYGGVENASFLAIHPDGRTLYAVSETGRTELAPGGAVAALAVDPEDGRLSFAGEALTHGAHPCYVSTDRAGTTLFVSNYSGGNIALLPIGSDGAPGEAALVIHEEAELGPNRDRQEAAHPHSIMPFREYVYMADLGTDTIFIFRHGGSASEFAYVGTCRLHPGAGPRHIAFHEELPYAYAVNELDSTVTTLKLEDGGAKLVPVQTVSALPEGYDGVSFAADIHLSPSGRHLYSSNRGHDSIAVFAVDPETGLLTAVQHASCGGQTPRNFAVSPDGGYLLAANQNSGTVIVFALDPESGMVGGQVSVLNVANPVCIRFSQL